MTKNWSPAQRKAQSRKLKAYHTRKKAAQDAYNAVMRQSDTITGETPSIASASLKSRLKALFGFLT